ncbi:MAG: hypothetical protein JOY81_09470 [Alphaproteobacteria bacterium]|nr:hypothetical protein [Alphaproteobacteria bacterium]
MFAAAQDLALRAARYVALSPDTSRLWTISVRHRVVGSLACEAGQWRLAWFDGADPRLSAYAGRLDGDLEALARALGRRIGLPVWIDLLAD